MLIKRMEIVESVNDIELRIEEENDNEEEKTCEGQALLQGHKFQLRRSQSPHQHLFPSSSSFLPI